MLLWIMRGENKRRDEEAVTNEAAKPDYDVSILAQVEPSHTDSRVLTQGGEGIADMTDRQMRSFRYKY